SDSGFSMASVNFCQLNQKVRELEEENYVLRQEHSRLTATADQLDEHESALIRDCARQLVSANMHIRTLSDEMAKKSDAFITQQSEVTRLLTRGLDLENRVKQLAAENEMLVNRLNESQAAQHSLSNELVRLRDKYDECVALYNDTRSEVRALRKRSRRACLRSGYLLSSGNILGSSMSSTPAQLFPSGSHADPDVAHSAPVNGSDGSSSSLELTVNGKTVTGEPSEQSLASELAHTAVKDQAVINTDRLFRAMDLARQARYRLGDDYGGPDEAVSSSGFVSGSEPSERPHELSGFSTHSSTMHKHSSMSNARNTVCTAQENRLFIDPHFIEPNDELSETQLKRHSWLGCDFVSRAENNSLDHTDRITSQGSMDDSLLMTSDPSTVYSQSYLRTPQRLQLVKPLDGSEVLQQWQRLATPSFTRALFEAPLPGVQSRAGVCNSPTEVYSLTACNRTAHRMGSVGTSVPYAPSLPTHCSYDPTCGTDAAKPARGEVLQSSTTTIRQAPELSRHILARDVLTTAKILSSCSRFGRTLPSQLLTAGVRSRSLEHLQSAFIRRNSRTGFTNYTPPVAPNTQEEPRSPPFSISSLVSAFLPFSLTPMCTDRRRSTDDTPSTEPIRIRPRSPPCSRGLLEVGKMDADPISLQRVPVAAQTRGISTAIQKLPTAQPPPVLTQAYARPSHTRTLRNTNLSGITEESGSPPKPDLEVVKTDAKTVGIESRHDA
ncbi:trafficking kinesin-binding protein 1, partial [Paragonimus westermani]